MPHTHLITVCLADGTILICPLIPDRTVQIMNIIGLALPDPQHLIRCTLDSCLSKRQCRKLLREIIPVHNTKLLHCISITAVLPLRTNLLALRTAAVIKDIPAHINKHLICVAHKTPATQNFIIPVHIETLQCIFFFEWMLLSSNPSIFLPQFFFFIIKQIIAEFNNILTQVCKFTTCAICHFPIAFNVILC